MKYAGAPRPLVERHHGDAGWEELADGVIVAGQPHGAPTWFPCNDRPDDKASYSITVTAAADYTVVANGELVARSAGPAHGHLALRAGRADGDLPGHRPDRPLRAPPVRRHAGPDGRRGPAGRGRRLRGRVRPAAGDAGGFVELFGPYPFAAYTVVVTADDLEIPLESQSLSTFGRNFCRDDWDASGWSPTSWRTSGSATP